MVCSSTKARVFGAIGAAMVFALVVTLAVVLSDDDNDEDDRSATSVAGGAGPCTLCANGETARNYYGGSVVHDVSCEALDSIIGNIDSGTEDCDILNLQTYSGCDCPTLPAGFCQMCPVTKFVSDIPIPRLPIPILDDMLCGDAFYMHESDLANESCDSLTRAAAFCGCPNAPERFCYVCADGTDSMDSSKYDKRLPPFYNVTCSELQALGIFQVTEEQCDDLSTENIAVDVQSYCGCPVSAEDASRKEAPNQCTLCGTGIELNSFRIVDKRIGLTCKMLADDIAPYVTSEAYCARIRDNFNAECCTPEPSSAPSTPPSAAPSPAPSATPSDAPSSVPTLSLAPSAAPTLSHYPTATPTSSHRPSDVPSDVPSDIPSDMPSDTPSTVLSSVPSDMPSIVPSYSLIPSTSLMPSISLLPTASSPPSSMPTFRPTKGKMMMTMRREREIRRLV